MQKIHSPGALARRGGARIQALATPRLQDGLWSFCLPIGRETPCGPSGRFRAFARAAGGGPGEGMEILT